MFLCILFMRALWVVGSRSCSPGTGVPRPFGPPGFERSVKPHLRPMPGDSGDKVQVKFTEPPGGTEVVLGVRVIQLLLLAAVSRPPFKLQPAGQLNPFCT